MGRCTNRHEPGDLPKETEYKQPSGKKVSMRFKKLALCISALVFGNIFGQDKNTTTNVLEEIIITDLVSKNFQKSQVKLFLSDSIIREHQGNLTQLLQFKTPIFFKENGYGMVSSPSFRGTTAQQTAVLWNGIPVNSFLLGQSDFNSIALKSYDGINITPGGSGVLQGSGAIGGSISLENYLVFKDRNEAEISLGYGSFSTYNASGRWQINSKKWSVDFTINHLNSENDFDQPKKGWKNKNGSFFSNTLGATLGYRLNDKHTFSYYGSTFLDERHFALVSINQLPTKYQNTTFRNMMRWQYADNQFESNLRIAHFYEQYKYFDNLPLLDFKEGNVSSVFAKWDGTYKINNTNKLASVISFTNSSGNGHDSGINNAKRTNIEASVLYSNQLADKIYVEAGAKIDYSSDYQTPFLYSAGLVYQPFQFYSIKARTSKNYRIPTFNDLYWQPGGNLDLKPEKSLQYEVNQEFNLKKINLSSSVYYNQIQNLIQWIPTSSGYWGAQNTAQNTIFGIELNGSYSLQLNKNTIQLNALYAYTSSKNPETNTYQIYVPLHKASAGITYTFNKKFGINVDALFMGEVYTRTNNDVAYNLDSYALINSSLWYEFGKTTKYKISLSGKNITNQMYQTVIERWLPGINYNAQLTIKI